MRKIKFRGFSVCQKKWVYGDIITSPNGEIKYIQTDKIKQNISDYQMFINQKTLDKKGCYFNNEVIEIYPDSAGQFTGEKDKNGKEIYEGDVLAAVGYHAKNVVKWNEDEGGYNLPRYDDGSFYNEKSWEIIGNIYETPKLLEVNNG